MEASVGTLRGRAYGWLRSLLPERAREALRTVPGVRAAARVARPTGDQWFPVRLGSEKEYWLLLPDDCHFIFYEEYERDSVEWIRSHVREGASCIDVGGHVGVLTTLLADLVGPTGSVHVFEPVPRNIELLRRTLERNGLQGRVTVVAAAVGEMDGEVATLRLGTSSSVGSIRDRGDGDSLEVPLVSLDAYATRAGLDRCDVLKMDIEGGEGAALRGAQAVLRELKPAVLVEVHGRAGADALPALVGIGYALATLEGAPIDPGCVPESVLHLAGIAG